jgi:DNA-binding SARP family transcriptional activator
MEFRVLGPFEAGNGSARARVGRRQERLLLALLLLGRGGPVTTGRLAELLWPDGPPPTARATLQTYVGRLRRVLGPAGLEVARVGDGYPRRARADRR